jgi:TRAP-type C4-dicarboxylate transport system substrate-binding protein
VFELPTVFTNNIVATNLAMRDVRPAPRRDRDVHVFLHVHAGQAIHMADTPVHHPADLKGMKLRVPGPTGIWVIQQLGATPVPMPVSDLPQALTTHAVDGALIPWEIIPALKLQDSTQYQIEGENDWRLGTTTFQVSMNKARWESLPDDLKAVFDKASDEAWIRQVGEIWRNSDNAGIKIASIRQRAHRAQPRGDGEFSAALAPVVDKWIAASPSRLVDGQTLVDTARATIAKYST